MYGTMNILLDTNSDVEEIDFFVANSPYQINVLAQLNDELPKTDVEALEKEIAMPGWGRWSGQAPTRGQKRKLEKAIDDAKRVREAAASARKDANKKSVVISEKVDRKALKYTGTMLPHPFSSREQFERSIRQPLVSFLQTMQCTYPVPWGTITVLIWHSKLISSGFFLKNVVVLQAPEMNTDSAFRNLVRPKVLRAAGQLISPPRMSASSGSVADVPAIVSGRSRSRS